MFFQIQTCVNVQQFVCMSSAWCFFLLRRVVEPKPGECPLFAEGLLRDCVRECEDDQDCAGTAKCCDNGCGLICADPEGPGKDTIILGRKFQHIDVNIKGGGKKAYSVLEIYASAY